jgi:hypothetical protein
LQPEAKGAHAKLAAPQWQANGALTAEEIYQLYFHGLAFQVLDRVQRAEDGVLGRMKAPLPPLVSADKILLINPRTLELALQTAGVWEAATTDTLALPSSIGWLKLYPAVELAEPLWVQVLPQEDADGALTFSAKVVDASGSLALELRDYRTTPLPFQAEAERITPFKRLVA